MLSMPNFEPPFEIETDASGVSLAAVLMQEGRPLAFISQAVSDRGRLKSVYEKELRDIIFAVQK